MVKLTIIGVSAFCSITTFIRFAVTFEIHNRQSSINAIDPFDHSWIEEWASLGDSYAVGLGAGHAIKKSDNVDLNPGGFFAGYCYQFSYGYPNLMNSPENLGFQPLRKFQYLGCSGALAANILEDQVALLKSPQMVTLSAGGNDAGLASILNYCIYQWFAPSLWDTCENVLKRSRDTVNSDGYTKGLTDLINGIKGKMRDSSNRIYWVAYNKFWDTANYDCDDVTWALPRIRNKQYLMKHRRQAMNDLLDLVNDKIKAVATVAGPQVVVVDWQAGTSAITGRYCEPGVNETWTEGHGVSEDREQTVFYEWGTTKDDDDDDEKTHDQLRKRQTITSTPNNAAANATFEGAIANYLIQGKSHDPDTYATAEQDLGFQITGSFLPDAYGRVFHVTKYGNSMIAKNVIDAITEEQGKLMNQPVVTKTLSCTIAAATATAPVTKEINDCHGVSGNLWVSVSPVEYNQNTVNNLRLSALNAFDTTSPLSAAPDCLKRFTEAVIDGCDGNDTINNPHNYKFGSAYTSPEGWVFRMEALDTKTDEDSCDVSYNVISDDFEIRGKNWPDAALGKDGAGLLSQLQGCGIVTTWNFTYTPDDVKFQWYAQGKLPLDTKGCVGRAVKSAGGASSGSCNGVG